MAAVGFISGTFPSRSFSIIFTFADVFALSSSLWKTAIFIRAYTLKSVTVKAPNPKADQGDKEKGVALVTSSDTRVNGDSDVDAENKVPDTEKVVDSGAEGSDRRV